MKMLALRCLVALTLLVAVTVAFANPFKSKIISGTDTLLEIIVPADHFMKITNFTQDGGIDRGVVEVDLPGDAPNGGSTNVLKATRINSSTGSAQSAPEIGNRVTIAGPARVRIAPVLGAKLFITYKKERDEGSGGGGGGGGETPIPIGNPTPSPTCTDVLGTPTPCPTATATATA
jgi:hypothetical protein